MNSTDQDRKPSACPWAAAHDARMRDIANRSFYTDAQIAKVDAVLMCMQVAYTARAFYKNYRKTCIVIKVEAGEVTDQVMLGMTERNIQRDPAYRQVKKVVTAQGICYEFFFK